MLNLISRGSEWGIWDLQIQTILDDVYIPLADYYQVLKDEDNEKWKNFTNKVGGESNALMFDSKEYFNGEAIPIKERRNNYVSTAFAFLETYKPELSLIGITDHNYYDE